MSLRSVLSICVFACLLLPASVHAGGPPAKEYNDFEKAIDAATRQGKLIVLWIPG